VKVVITTPLADRLGGAENMLWALLRHLDRERVEPFVVFFQAGPFQEEVAEVGIPTSVLRTGRLREFWRGPLVVGALAGLLRREQPDFLLNWMAKSHLYGAPAALVSGVRSRVVWWQHGIPDRHWMDRLATIAPSCAIACSSRAAAEHQGRLKPRRRTFVVHPGIDLPRPANDQARKRRRPLEIPQGRLVIGIVGRLQPDKGQDKVIEAVGRLRARGHNVHGLVVGGNAWNLAPEYETSLRRLVIDLGLNSAVTFTGQVPDAEPFIRSMDVLVNASVSEGCPLVLLEAMALGIPVVANAGSGGPVEVIESEEYGILAASNDPAALVDALERLVTSADLRRRLGEGGRRRFLDYFTADRMARAFEKSLEELR
jgi:glycosyltransferase involved in cell wall biosynthesis